MQLGAVVLIAFTATAVKGEDECAPKQGEGNVDQCCDLYDILPKSFPEATKACSGKFKSDLPGGPPPSGTKDAARTNRHACMVECMFSENKMLTVDNKLDVDAITKAMTSATSADMTPVVIAAIEKCIGVEVDPDVECKSGSAEFRQCLGREVFFNCPPSLWTSTKDCDDLKDKMKRCPMIHVMMIKHAGPPPK